jgi:hypothetical protein
VLLCSETATGTATSEPTATAEPTEAAESTTTTTAAAPTASTSTPSATPATKRKGKEQTSGPAAAAAPARAENRHYDDEYHEQDERIDTAAARRTNGCTLAGRRKSRRGRLQCRVELEIEFGRESLRDSQRHQLDRVAVVPLPEKRDRLILYFTSRCVGDKSFGAVARLDGDVPGSVATRLARNDENQRGPITRWISWFPSAAHLPGAADLQRHVAHVSALQIGKGDDSDVAARFRPNVLGDSLKASDVVGRDHIREIIHEPDRRWHLQLANLDLQRRRESGEHEPEARHEIDRR